MSSLIAIAFLVTCLAGTAFTEECVAKINDFHKCMKDSMHDQHHQMKADFEEEIKPKINACFTNNGCTPPGDSESGEESNATDAQPRQCKKEMKAAMMKQIEECVQKDNPGITLPEKDGQAKNGEGRGLHLDMDDEHVWETCSKKEAVQACVRSIFNNSQPSEEELKTHFQAHCDALKKCQTPLGSGCQTQLDNVKKAFCQCNQQIMQKADQIRASVASCNGVESKGPPHNDHVLKQSCEEKDYCALGYDAFVKDNQAEAEHH